MKIGPIIPHSLAPSSFDVDQLSIDHVLDVLVSSVKAHGHFGNLVHHDSRGDWASVTVALRDIVLTRGRYETLSPLGRNLARLLSGNGPVNVRPFRSWLLDILESMTSNLLREIVARHIDQLNSMEPAVRV